MNQKTSRSKKKLENTLFSNFCFH